MLVTPSHLTYCILDNCRFTPLALPIITSSLWRPIGLRPVPYNCSPLTITPSLQTMYSYLTLCPITALHARQNCFKPNIPQRLENELTNAVEEDVYEVSKKLCEEMEQYVADAERENWFYEDCEDCL